MSRAHGLSGYTGGCRCDICREAKRRYNRAYHQNRPPMRVTRRWATVSPATFTWPELIALELMKPVEQRVKVPLQEKPNV